MNTHKPIIAIVSAYAAIKEPHPFSAFTQHYCVDSYIQAVFKSGALPFMVPSFEATDEDLHAILSSVDGILLPGGADVDPSLYGEEKDEACGDIISSYDTFTIRLIKEARKRNLPILGICKGTQILNVAFGGSLYQDQKFWRETENPEFVHMHMQEAKKAYHPVLLKEGSNVSEIFHGAKQIETNSLHHQAIKEVGKGLIVTARCIDGTIETVEAEDGAFCMGIQWHPEVMYQDTLSMRNIFITFIQQCKKDA